MVNREESVEREGMKRYGEKRRGAFDQMRRREQDVE